MDVERLLISRIIQDKDFVPVAENSITSKFFLDPQSHQVFETIVRHVNQYGAVPTLVAIRADFPDYQFIKVEEPYPFLIDKIKEQHELSILEEGLAEAVDLHRVKDLEAVKFTLADTLNQIALDLPNTRDVDITQTGADRLERYKEYRNTIGQLRGLPTGFASLDRATLGWQKQNLVFFVGPPKAGKSTLLLLAAIAAHMYGLRPLLFTFEMSNDEMTERMDAIRAEVGHSRLREGALNKEEWKKLQRYLNALETAPPFWMSADTNSATTLSGIAAKIDQIKPDIVFLDGVYMLTDEVSGEVNTTTALTNLTRGFKRLAQNKEIPLIATTQVLLWKMDKKKGITTNSIGYSSSFAQDADVIIGVENTEDDAIQKLKVVEARNIKKFETFVLWDWDTGNFTELEDNPFGEREGGGWDDRGAGF